MKPFHEDVVYIPDPPPSLLIDKKIKISGKRRQKHSKVTVPLKSFDIEVKPRPERSKNVSFNPIKRYRTMKHINDFTAEERIDIWYSNAELAAVVKECAITVLKVVQGENLKDEDGICIRGLEFKTPEGAKFKKGNKACATWKVLKEQELQKKTGIANPEFLAHIYSDTTRKSRCVARLMGHRDEDENCRLLQSVPAQCIISEKLKLRSSSPTSSPTSVVNAVFGMKPRNSCETDNSKKLRSWGQTINNAGARFIYPPF